MKKFQFVLLAINFIFVISCGNNAGENGYSYNNNGDTPVKKNFYTSSCDELGGLEMSTGACYIPCKSDSDCAEIEGAETCWSPIWPVAYCQPKECSNLEGWIDKYGCFMRCDGANDTSSCPVNFNCLYDDIKYVYFCSGYSKGNNNNNQGVCSGCGYPFCDGRCKGCC